MTGSPAADSSPFALDGVRMRVTQTAEGGEVGVTTIFHFQQNGDEVLCPYAGGEVAHGFLIGTLVHDTLRFVYVQRGHDGRLDAGTSTGILERLPDGRISMREHFRWFSRDGEGVNVFEEIARTQDGGRLSHR